MSTGSRVLTAWYLTVATAAAWTSVTSFGEIPLQITLALLAITATPLIAVWRECDLRDERRHVAALLERQAREQQRLNGRPLNQHEQADWQRLLARLDLTGPDDDRSSTT